MVDLQQPRCANLEQAGFDAQRVAEEVWEDLLSAEVFVEGNYILASGAHATLKADLEKLYSKPRQLARIMGHFATFPCVQDADVLLYVPEGMKDFMTMLGKDLGKPVAAAERRPRAASKYDFVFSSPEDKALAQAAKAPLIGEDVVTTLGSVAGLRKLLLPGQQAHSLAILLRGMVNPLYRTGLVDHYLLEKEIPTDKYEFRRMLARS